MKGQLRNKGYKRSKNEKIVTFTNNKKNASKKK